MTDRECVLLFSISTVYAVWQLFSQLSSVMSNLLMSKMADAAAARREARRKKILENSGNRLQRIAGKSGDEFPKGMAVQIVQNNYSTATRYTKVVIVSESPIRSIRPIPEPEYEIPDSASSSSYSKTSQYNGVFHQPEPFQFIPPSHEIDAAGDGEVTYDSAPYVPPTILAEPAPVPIVPLWENITSYKYDIVLLSLFIQLLYGLSLISFDNGAGGYFFLPVIVYIATKLVWFPVQSTSNVAMVMLLVPLIGISQSRLQNIMYVTQCFSVITRDTFLYLFTTICIQTLWTAVHNLLVT